MIVVPYGEDNSGKKQQVAAMFNNISHRYDLLNHLLSMGIDIRWRKKAIRLMKPHNPKLILDVATGTGDFAIEALSLGPDKVTGVDIADGMLARGREKLGRLGLKDKIELLHGDSEELAFPDNKFDSVIVAFGVRNFENLRKGLSEMFRVIRPGGIAVIVEFSKPGKFPFKQVYNFYFRHVLPRVGRVISKDRSAYSYLPASVMAFPDGEQFIDILSSTGFKEIKCYPLTFGISSIYIGYK
ncbi:MAG TPA: bifunctional demethylmenaquinone methyltransferase/2-methoxy-6-polyprenyl-1,4-benzoquinol methylase UbiE [Cyclobacteriaceae bacterium]|nr:bifunctional demethylmenaquinone methyltransferase/2-methoxy-6-polyprenyl-1,4-benzoquinol methylase UbiE [Cyclobacteriaceae bacterium]